MKTLTPLIFIALITACGGSEGKSGQIGDSCKTTEDCSGELSCNPTTATCEGPCGASWDCPSPSLCNPASNSCEVGIPCDNHSDCGTGAHCTSAGICGRSETGSPCDSNDDCIGTEECFNNFCGCTAQEFESTAVAPNVLMLIDRSGSMSGSNWTATLNALQGLFNNYQGEADFGLMLYPSDDNCGVLPQLHVAPAPQNGANILSTMQANPPGGLTPLGEAILAAGNLTQYHPTNSGKPLVLVVFSDGYNSCGDPNVLPAVQQMAAEGITTFMVGFGSGTDTVYMDQVAQAGGTGSHYQASNQQGLQMALESIAGSVRACEYELDEVPVDPDSIVVRVNGVEVPRDQTQSNGWDYDPATNRVIFYGFDCEQVRLGDTDTVQILGGCAIPE